MADDQSKTADLIKKLTSRIDDLEAREAKNEEAITAFNGKLNPALIEKWQQAEKDIEKIKAVWSSMSRRRSRMEFQLNDLENKQAELDDYVSEVSECYESMRPILSGRTTGAATARSRRTTIKSIKEVSEDDDEDDSTRSSTVAQGREEAAEIIAPASPDKSSPEESPKARRKSRLADGPRFKLQADGPGEEPVDIKWEEEESSNTKPSDAPSPKKTVAFNLPSSPPGEDNHWKKTVKKKVVPMANTVAALPRLDTDDIMDRVFAEMNASLRELRRKFSMMEDKVERRMTGLHGEVQAVQKINRETFARMSGVWQMGSLLGEEDDFSIDAAFGNFPDSGLTSTSLPSPPSLGRISENSLGRISENSQSYRLDLERLASLEPVKRDSGEKPNPSSGAGKKQKPSNIFVPQYLTDPSSCGKIKNRLQDIRKMDSTLKDLAQKAKEAELEKQQSKRVMHLLGERVSAVEQTLKEMSTERENEDLPPGLERRMERARGWIKKNTDEIQSVLRMVTEIRLDEPKMATEAALTQKELRRMGRDIGKLQADVGQLPGRQARKNGYKGRQPVGIYDPRAERTSRTAMAMADLKNQTRSCPNLPPIEKAHSNPKRAPKVPHGMGSPKRATRSPKKRGSGMLTFAPPINLEYEHPACLSRMPNPELPTRRRKSNLKKKKIRSDLNYLEQKIAP